MRALFVTSVLLTLALGAGLSGVPHRARTGVASRASLAAAPGLPLELRPAATDAVPQDRLDLALRDADGRPLRGATLVLRVPVPGARASGDLAVGRGLSDADGIARFDLAALRALGRHQLRRVAVVVDVDRGDAPAWRARFGCALGDAPIRRELVVPASSGAVVRGRVVDDAGIGIAGATVRWSDGGHAPERASVSGPDGAFAIELPARRGSLVAWHAAHGMSRFVGAPDADERQFELAIVRPLGVLRGRVLQTDGRPAAGLAIRLQRLGEARDAAAGAAPALTADRHGRFTVAGLAPGRYRAVWDAAGAPEELGVVDVHVGTQDVAWRLAKLRLDVAPIDAHGLPVADAWIRVQWWQRAGDARGELSVAADAGEIALPSGVSFAVEVSTVDGDELHLGGHARRGVGALRFDAELPDPPPHGVEPAESG